MEPDRVKHLEFLQTNIARMNQCSFQMKRWPIRIVSALLAVYAATINDLGEGNKAFLIVAVFPTIIFWFLDSYYLTQERKFRGIYNDVAGINKDNPQLVEIYDMPLGKYKGGKYSFIRVMFSKTIWPLYLGIMTCLLVGAYILK